MLNTGLCTKMSVSSSKSALQDTDDQQKCSTQAPYVNILRKSNCSAYVGAFTFTLGILIFCTRSLILDVIISSTIVLKPDSAIAEAWSKMPMALPTDIYFFNWTNPEDFRHNNIKPKFKQVGPYRFMQNMEKVNVIWNHNNTVTYNQVRYWHFDDTFNNKNLSDKITSINAITLGASHYMRNWNYIIKRAASIILATIAPHLQTTRTVNQLLFEGYDDLIVDIARHLPFIAAEVPRFDRFGWFRIINGSSTFEGVYNMENGVNGNFEIRNWNYGNVTPYFDGSCANVHGYGGELYSSKLTKDYVGIFLTHLCRYLRFDFEDEVTIDGVLGYKYSIGHGVLDNGTLIPENECYCAGNCLPSGMINVSSCRYGSPTYVSLPNYYKADPVYLHEVEGLQPEQDVHESYIILEPTTGLPLKAVVRLQLNILVQPVEGIGLYENVRKIFFPLLWVEQKATLPDNAMLMLKILLHFPYVLIGIAVVLIIWSLYLLVFIAFKPAFVSLFRRMWKQKRCMILKSEVVLLQCNGEKSGNSSITKNREFT